MKQYQKIYLLFLLVFFTTASTSFAQSGDSCNSAFAISYSPGATIQVSFENREYTWLAIAIDTPGVEVEISPDSLSEYANIASIDLYNGNNCSSKTLLWSQEYVDADSLQINHTIHFILEEPVLQYFLKVNR